MTTAENGQSPKVREIEGSLAGLTKDINSIDSAAIKLSGGIWTRYGTSGGSLVFGGAVAIVALTATMTALSGWTPEDLITCMGFAVLLIIIGTVAQLVNAHINSRTFEVQARLHEKHEETVRQVLAALEKERPVPSVVKEPIGP